MRVAAPDPWVPAYAGTTVVGVWGCWLGTTVVRVAAPDPWVPAYAGTTVVGVWGCWLGDGVAAPVLKRLTLKTVAGFRIRSGTSRGGGPPRQAVRAALQAGA